MNKNYYDILQVNKNASPEVIEKVYKILAKKYHPDLQPDSNKQASEIIFKEINEAYETLSNPEKRKQYDESLNQLTVSIEEFNKIYNENQILKQQLYELNINQSPINSMDYNNFSNTSATEEVYFEEELEKARQQAYQDAYIQDLKNRGYKIKYKKGFIDYLKGFVAIIITIYIVFILYNIPFIKNFLIHIFPAL